MKNIIYSIICIIIFTSCELERDNPLDSKSNITHVGSPTLSFSKVEVISDDNSNGIIEVGEHIKLKVFIKNTGSNAKGVIADFTFENYMYVYLYGGSAYYGDISTSSEIAGSLSSVENYSVRFDLNYDIPIGTKKKIIMKIKDQNGNVWINSFTITIQ